MITQIDLAKLLRYGDSRIPQYFNSLVSAMEEFSITSPIREAMFLAQIAHESGELRYVEELATGDAYTNRKDLGNREQQAIDFAALAGTSVGNFYKGRGFIQITGYYNYKEYDLATQCGCTANPKILARPPHCARSAAWFWKTKGLNEIADTGNFEKTTRIINGGLNGQKERLRYFEEAKKILRVA